MHPYSSKHAVYMSAPGDSRARWFRRSPRLCGWCLRGRYQPTHLFTFVLKKPDISTRQLPSKKTKPQATCQNPPREISLFVAPNNRAGPSSSKPTFFFCYLCSSIFLENESSFFHPAASPFHILREIIGRQLKKRR